MAATLAQVADLAATLQATVADDDATALLHLRTASGKVRDYLRQQVSFQAADVVILDPIEGSTVQLPELPVTAITTVEVLVQGTWQALTTDDYVSSKRTGTIQANPISPVRFPAGPETWRVTYDHGWEEIPDSIIGVCAAHAARTYASAVGVDLERAGGVQIKYSAAGFTPDEVRTLDNYAAEVIA